MTGRSCHGLAWLLKVLISSQPACRQVGGGRSAVDRWLVSAPRKSVPFNLRLVTRSIVKASDKKVPANFLQPGRARILTHACPVIPHLRHRCTKSKPVQEPSAGAASTSGGFDGRGGKGAARDMTQCRKPRAPGFQNAIRCCFLALHGAVQCEGAELAMHQSGAGLEGPTPP